MVTAAENERLAVVETEVKLIKSDVADIKVDVKTLLAANAVSSGIATAFRVGVPVAALVVSIIALLSR